MRILKKVLFVIGIALLFYPLISGIIQKKMQQEVIATYEQQSKRLEKSELIQDLEQAEQYNALLYQTQGTGIGTTQQEILSEETYRSLLNLTGTGMMGSLSIPKIHVELPIYHGTEEQVLATAVGHVENTSLPIGGENTHSVLSGHRGLPTAKLFTRLDELEEQDLFFIYINEEQLAYQVVSVQVIEPTEVEGLMIQPEKDLVSLVTCTPYGINTHRLVVTGERVDCTEEVIKIVPKFSYSWRELAFALLPFVILIAVTIQKVWEIYKKKTGRGVKRNEKAK